jgi:hypothetical protein
MVVYIVCFDLEQDCNDQLNQITFWLEFLSSSLPNFLPSSTVMIVGLKSDVKHPSTSLSTSHIKHWQDRFKKLHLFESDLFTISSLKAKDSVSHLLQCVERECKRIFDAHSITIPKAYHDFLQAIKQINSDNNSSPSSSSSSSSSSSPSSVSHCPHHFTSPSKLPSCGLDEIGKKLALRYFHSTGHVVLLDDDTVCIDPTIIPKIAAKFISPVEVRNKLLTKEVTILDENEIYRCLLDIHDDSNEQ